MKRRSFLKVGAAGLGASLLLGRKAFAAPFGTFPSALADRGVPAARRPFNVLEIFLSGGLSAWETFYYVDAYGRPDDPQYPNTQFHTDFGSPEENYPAALSQCAFPDGEPLGVPFARDANGMDVAFGPFAYRLRARPDLTDRMRVLVQQHDLEPHEAAIPFAMTGKRLGVPSQAAIGAHVQRYYAEHPDAGHRSPYSYAIAPIQAIQAEVAVSTGIHPSSARPTLINLSSSELFYASLARPAVGSAEQRAAYDRLLGLKGVSFAERLKWRGEEIRSKAAREHAQSAAAMADAQVIQNVLDPSLLVKRGATVCGQEVSFDPTSMGLKLAAHLLTHPTEPARHVFVEDRGVAVPGADGYDSHEHNSVLQAIHVDHMLAELAAIINAPGEDDPAKLDLDRTMIVINTEFGRTPWADAVKPNGRNHHPYAYVTAMLGGPVTPDQRGIEGAIGPDGMTTNAITPGMNRIAVLLAMGIYPFAQESFDLADVVDAGDEATAVDVVAERCLGYRR